ncbi:methyl-accepting chemotaxis protein [Sporomusa acidovorans]|uniref:Methyl-accepting chemotaxis protein McpB n=1 Tax=Sporomusa acidovorans (strain ATCC 49682 / DSM 3132 / Mol) TaxID=1123286 RepID=A0ABZ3J1I0_SPOA4|nr:methyl-accepting chemotaxis protein [Sporomusa acidovorans]OZC16550.1 methyl-accepting chemotaxis protein McpB [Sporomusa acidovorans DSM 3132]SDF60953.1 methyl-accepting chemotaxis sensory transducer with Cache sensor [Sporomusa acidovorans]
MNCKTISIRTKLLIIILSLTVISLGSLASLTYFFSKQYLVRSTQETALAIGTDYAVRVQMAVNEMLIHMQDLGSIQQVRSGTDQTYIVSALRETHKRLGSFDIITFIDMNGMGIRFNGSSADHNDRDFFKKVVSTQKPYVSDPIISKSTGKLSIQVAVPVFDNGKMTGVMNGSVSLERLANMLADVKFKDSGYGLLCDSSGVIIADARHPELIGKLSIGDNGTAAGANLENGKLDQRLITLFKLARESGNQVQGSYTFIDGINYVAVLTPINLPGNQNWIMVVMTPESEITREVDMLTRISLLVSFIFLFIAVVVAVYISKVFTKPISIITGEAMLLANNDLRLRQINIHSEDEIGQLGNSFKKMAKNLRNLLAKVQTQAESVAASGKELSASTQQSAQASNQVADVIGQIAQSSEQQNSAVSNMSSVAEAMSENIVQIVDNGKHVEDIAKDTAQVTTEGHQAINQIMIRMQEIGGESENVHKTIKKLVDGSQTINSMVNLISAIAGQTNLLALNAAIEAARAGEHGRGFAVVAEEVRKLSQDSNQAAHKIATLIQQHGHDMEVAIAAVQSNSDGVNAGMEAVNVAKDKFGNIADAVMHLSNKIQEIVKSLDQIAEGSSTLVESVHSIGLLNKENAMATQSVSAATEEQLASMQEIASACQLLAKIAGELQEETEKFKL